MKGLHLPFKPLERIFPAVMGAEGFEPPTPWV